jgi:hypothetical protein
MIQLLVDLRNTEKLVLQTKIRDTKFYGTLETEEEIKINVEKEEYFVRCSVNIVVLQTRNRFEKTILNKRI